MQFDEPPEHIWLQYHGDADPADYPNDPGPHADDISWCWEPIFEHDIKYVRADTIDQLRQQLSDVQADNAKLRIWKEYVEMNSKEAGYMADEFMKTLKPTQDKGIIFEEASDVTEDMFQPTQDGR